jgi:hypothetical protein
MKRRGCGCAGAFTPKGELLRNALDRLSLLALKAKNSNGNKRKPSGNERSDRKKQSSEHGG